MSGFDFQTEVRNGDFRGPLVDGDDDIDVHSVPTGVVDPMDWAAVVSAVVSDGTVR